MTTYAIIFLLSFISTVFLTPYLIIYLKRGGIIDQPGERKVHQETTPRMGGVIIFGIITFVLFVFAEDLNALRYLIIGSLLITVCGIIDDIIGIKWSFKFFIQFLSAIFVILYLSPFFSSMTIFGIVLPPYLDMVILFIFVVGVINSINLMDGMDGLVSGFSLFVFVIVFALSVINDDRIILLLSAGFIGSLLGFLKFNAFPAKVFLGDTGSLFLGFFLVLFTLKTSINYRGGTMDLGFPTLMLAVPIIDTLKVMFKRMLSGKNPFLPDNNHLHHIIYNNKFRHKTTVFIIQTFTLMFIGLSLLYLKFASAYVIYAFVILSMILISAHTIVQWVNSIVWIKSVYHSLVSKVANDNVYYRSYLIYFSMIGAAGAVVASLSYSTYFEYTELLFLLFFGLAMTGISMIHNKNSNTVIHIYFFNNITFLYFISSIMANNGELMFAIRSHLPNLFPNSIVIMMIATIVLIIARGKVITKEEVFLSGIDLTMIVMIMLVFIVQNIINYAFYNLITESLLIGFVFYLWYKVIVFFIPRVLYIMYYSSFVVVILYLLSAIILIG